MAGITPADVQRSLSGSDLLGESGIEALEGLPADDLDGILAAGESVQQVLRARLQDLKH